MKPRIELTFLSIVVIFESIRGRFKPYAENFIKKTLKEAKPIEENYKGNNFKSKKEHYIKRTGHKTRAVGKKRIYAEGNFENQSEEANKHNLISKGGPSIQRSFRSDGRTQTAYAEWENVVADMQVSTRLFFCKEIQRVSSHK